MKEVISFKKQVLLVLRLIILSVCSTIFGLPGMVITSEAAESLTMLEDNNLPVVYLEIDENAEGYGTIQEMNNSKDHSVKCTGTVRIDVPDNYKGDYSDTFLEDTGALKLSYIRGRGNSTWRADKKPYKIKLDKKADLLGMGKNKHWALLANRYDSSMLRNRLISYIGQSIGLSYTPKMLPVDLVMNGEYLGTYHLSETIRIDSNRVDIDELNSENNQEPEVSGGYLLGLNPYPSDPAQNTFLTSRKQAFWLESPEFYTEEAGEEVGTKEQKDYICNYLQQTEDAIFGINNKNAAGTSYTEYMDIESAVDYWWIQEFTLNIDAFRTPSSYLYKKRSDKLYWGPLWDFDFSMGNRNHEVKGFDNAPNIWLDHLRKTDTSYQRLLRKRWPTLRQIFDEVVKDGGILDQYQNEISASYKDDLTKWRNDYYLKTPRNDLETEIKDLKKWIIRRQAWVTEHVYTNRLIQVHTNNYSTEAEEGPTVNDSESNFTKEKQEVAAFSQAKPMIRTTPDVKKAAIAIHVEAVEGATDYKVAYKEAKSSLWNYQFTGGKQDCSIKKLKKKGLYEIKVAACRAGGGENQLTTGNWSDVDRIYLSTVTGVRIRKGNHHSLKVYWNKDSKAAGYQILYYPKTSSPSVEQNSYRVMVKGKKKHFHTITRLKKRKKYSIQVRPYKKKGGKIYTGAYSKAVVSKVK